MENSRASSRDNPNVKANRRTLAIRKACLARALAGLEVGLNAIKENLKDKRGLAQIAKIDGWIEKCWRTVYPQRIDIMGGGFLRDWHVAMGEAEKIVSTTLPADTPGADYASAYILAHHLMIADAPIVHRQAMDRSTPWQFLAQTVATLWSWIHASAKTPDATIDLGVDLGLRLYPAIFEVQNG